MPIYVIMERDAQARFVDALKNNRPIEPPAGGWSLHEMLNLAGAALAFAKGAGPRAWFDGSAARAHPEHLHRERYELEVDKVRGELLAAIDTASELTEVLAYGIWDNVFDSEVVCKTSFKGEQATNCYTTVRGFKVPPPDGKAAS